MTFEESKKSKKTVASMITNKKDEKKPANKKNVSSKGKENKSPKGKHGNPEVRNMSYR